MVSNSTDPSEQIKEQSNASVLSPGATEPIRGESATGSLALLPRQLQRQLPSLLDAEFEDNLLNVSLNNDDSALTLCSLFLSDKKTRRLDEYSNVPREKLLSILNVISESLTNSEDDFAYFRHIANSGGDLQKYICERESLGARSFKFMKYIMRIKNYSPTLSDIDSLLSKWGTEIYISRYNLKNESIEVSQTQLDAYMRIKEIAIECCDHDYMRLICGLFDDIHHRNQNVNPFIFLCAPSGSGKSILAYNLSTAPFPLLYFVYNSKWDKDKTQDLYLPFEILSKKLRKVVRADIEILLGNNYFAEKVNTDALADLTEVKLNTVHFFVWLFEKLVGMKGEGDTYDWMKIQLSLKRYEEGQLSINEGNIRLRAIDILHPLVTIFDECIIDRVTSDPKREETEFVFLRSTLRLLKLIPMFAGTDAESSNFCTQWFSNSREKDRIILWCKVINDLPRFAVNRLRRLCLQILDQTNQREAFAPILNFLQKSYVYENPYLIQLCLDHLLEASLASTCHNVLDLLNGMILDVFDTFYVQKKSPSAFTRGQLEYITHFSWLNNQLIVNKFNEGCINKHLAFLNGVQIEKGKPYFDLKLKSSLQYYLRPNEVKNRKRMAREIPFTPRAIFSPFQKSPLTGLVLFGIDSAYNIDNIQPSLLDDLFRDADSIVNISSLDAVIEHFWQEKDMSSGKFIERVYTTAVVVASRVSGPSGCSFSAFIDRLVREFHTARDGSPKSRIQKDIVEIIADLPSVIVNDAVFGDKWIPLVSPMSVDEWPQCAVDLLLTASNGQCRLGTFQFSTGNEVVDHVIFEMNVAASVNLIEDEMKMILPEYHEKKAAKTLKVFSEWGKPLKVKKEAIKRIALVTECKQYANNLSMSCINDIITRKFDKLHNWSLLKELNVRACNLFIIFTLHASDFSKTSPGSEQFITEINKKKYRLWHLTKTVDGVFEVQLVSGQMHMFDSEVKEVVILPLNTIVGNDFIFGLYPDVLNLESLRIV